MHRNRTLVVGALIATMLVTFLPPGRARAVASGDITVEEQQLIYELNRARRDPAGYAADHPELAAAGAIAAAEPRPPLAVTGALFGSAGAHAEEMATAGYVAHQSPITGMWPNAMARSAGYPLMAALPDDENNIESVTAGNVTTPGGALAVLLDSEAHRIHLLGTTPFFALHREAGGGVAFGTPWSEAFPVAGYWAIHTGYDGGSAPFLTGVVYADSNRNGRMDLGEGLPGVDVSAAGTVTSTNPGGGWSIRVAPGARYEVVASGPGFATRRRIVGVAGDNVEVDFSSLPARDTVSLFDPASGAWYLRFADGSGDTFFFGEPGDTPLMADWDCDGIDTPGLYRPAGAMVYVAPAGAGEAVTQFSFGEKGDIVLVGDWDGDGCDTPAVYREGQMLISNHPGGGVAESSYYFGRPGDRPFVGDFDGDGIDTIGLYRRETGFVYFRNRPSTGVAEVEFYYGVPSDRIVAGDWDGDGLDTVGVFRPSEGRLYLSNVNGQARAVAEQSLGRPGWLPVAGAPG